jgi:hypothetical protein
MQCHTKKDTFSELYFVLYRTRYSFGWSCTVAFCSWSLQIKMDMLLPHKQVFLLFYIIITLYLYYLIHNVYWSSSGDT